MRREKRWERSSNRHSKNLAVVAAERKRPEKDEQKPTRQGTRRLGEAESRGKADRLQCPRPDGRMHRKMEGCQAGLNKSHLKGNGGAEQVKGIIEARQRRFTGEGGSRPCRLLERKEESRVWPATQILVRETEATFSVAKTKKIRLRATALLSSPSMGGTRKSNREAGGRGRDWAHQGKRKGVRSTKQA